MSPTPFIGKAETTREDRGMRMFVGGLALTVLEADLRQVLTHYGRVASVQILQERETGRSRGFGFVEMPSAPEAQAALEGRLLTVNEARQREERCPRGEGDGHRPRW